MWFLLCEFAQYVLLVYSCHFVYFCVITVVLAWWHSISRPEYFVFEGSVIVLNTVNKTLSDCKQNIHGRGRISTRAFISFVLTMQGVAFLYGFHIIHYDIWRFLVNWLPASADVGTLYVLEPVWISWNIFYMSWPHTRHHSAVLVIDGCLIVLFLQ